MKTNPFIQLEEDKNHEAILFNPRTLENFWLNETALYIWKQLKEGVSSKDIIHSLTSHHEHPGQPLVQKQFDELIHFFKQNNLILTT